MLSQSIKGGEINLLGDGVIFAINTLLGGEA